MRRTLSKAVCIIVARYLRRLPYNDGIPEQDVSLNKQQVQHIAMLARLSLDDEEIDDVVTKLSSIVDFVDQLQAVPTDHVLPMAHPLDHSQRLRADVVTEAVERDKIQKNAPQVQDGLYLVPKVIA